MNCPPDIAGILLEIIGTAVLRIRALAWARDADRCAVEADHVHNLPALLRDYSPDLLKFYWEVERPAFIRQSSGADLADFELLWRRLAGHAEGLAARASAR